MLGGLLLKLALGGLALAAATVIISGIIDKYAIQEQMRKKNISNGMVKAINRCSNTLTIENMDGEEDLEIQGDGISNEIYDGQLIYI